MPPRRTLVQKDNNGRHFLSCHLLVWIGADNVAVLIGLLTVTQLVNVKENTQEDATTIGQKAFSDEALTPFLLEGSEKQRQVFVCCKYQFNGCEFLLISVDH